MGGHRPETGKSRVRKPSRVGVAPIRHSGQPGAELRHEPRRSPAPLDERQLLPSLLPLHDELPPPVRQRPSSPPLPLREGSACCSNLHRFPSVSVLYQWPSLQSPLPPRLRPQPRLEPTVPAGEPARQHDDAVAHGTRGAKLRNRDTSLRVGWPMSKVRQRLPASLLPLDHRACPCHVFPCLSSCASGVWTLI